MGESLGAGHRAQGTGRRAQGLRKKVPLPGDERASEAELMGGFLIKADLKLFLQIIL